jgi:hypothetical protein
MKKLLLTTLIVLLVIGGCQKIDVPIIKPQIIELGKTSTSTQINNITQVNNVFTIGYTVTTGAKYSVQIIPFGSETPVKTLGFTALTDTVTKTYDLNSLDKEDYDIILIDINGTETKRPIKIK